MHTRADAIAVLTEARELLAQQPDAQVFELSRDELLMLLSLCEPAERDR